MNCYNIGQIKGTSYVGGIGGYTYYSKCEIKNCYNIGKVSGNSNLGGILGKNENSTEFVNSYYLEGTANLDSGDKTTSNCKKDKVFITSTFVTTANSEETIWKVDNAQNDGWPIFNEQ